MRNDEITPKVGDKIKAFGQIEKVIDIEDGIIFLEHQIVVPGCEYTRDMVYPKEIQEIL